MRKGSYQYMAEFSTLRQCRWAYNPFLYTVHGFSKIHVPFTATPPRHTPTGTSRFLQRSISNENHSEIKNDSAAPVTHLQAFPALFLRLALGRTLRLQVRLLELQGCGSPAVHQPH